MSNTLPPVGGTPIDPSQFNPVDTKKSEHTISIPQSSGLATSPESVLGNCGKLNQEALPSALREVVNRTEKDDGMIVPRVGGVPISSGILASILKLGGMSDG